MKKMMMLEEAVGVGRLLGVDELSHSILQGVPTDSRHS